MRYVFLIREKRYCLLWSSFQNLTFPTKYARKFGQKFSNTRRNWDFQAFFMTRNFTVGQFWNVTFCIGPTFWRIQLWSNWIRGGHFPEFHAKCYFGYRSRPWLQSLNRSSRNLDCAWDRPANSHHFTQILLSRKSAPSYNRKFLIYSSE